MSDFDPTKVTEEDIARWGQKEAEKLEADQEELSTLRARVAELEAALIEARDTFRHYGDLHAAKPDMVKAQRNYDLADRMEAALNPTQRESK